MSTAVDELKGWLPYQLEIKQPILCKWVFTGQKRFDEPFFSQTIANCKNSGFLANPNNLVPSSAVEVLPGWATGLNAVQPSAFIFHVSRCGSTLAAQLLGVAKEHTVLSEPPFFDELLLNQCAISTQQPFADLFKAAIFFYGQRRLGCENRFFIKTDSWHILFYKQLRQMYPEVPFILLYRQPGEVLRSHQKLRGRQMVPGLIAPELFGFNPDVIKQLTTDEYTVKVLERYFECFLEIAMEDDFCYLVNYNEGAYNIVQKIAGLTQTVFNPADIELIRQRSNFHSKYPEKAFNEPVNEAPLPGFLKTAAGLYDALESKRLAL